jgi:hypothetical protein
MNSLHLTRIFERQRDEILFKDAILSVCNISENNMQEVPSMYYMKERQNFRRSSFIGKKFTGGRFLLNCK